jgi:hypothetical protein
LVVLTKHNIIKILTSSQILGYYLFNILLEIERSEVLKFRAFAEYYNKEFYFQKIFRFYKNKTYFQRAFQLYKKYKKCSNNYITNLHILLRTFIHTFSHNDIKLLIRLISISCNEYKSLKILIKHGFIQSYEFYRFKNMSISKILSKRKDYTLYINRGINNILYLYIITKYLVKDYVEKERIIVRNINAFFGGLCGYCDTSYLFASLLLDDFKFFKEFSKKFSYYESLQSNQLPHYLSGYIEKDLFENYLTRMINNRYIKENIYKVYTDIHLIPFDDIEMLFK